MVLLWSRFVEDADERRDEEKKGKDREEAVSNDRDLLEKASRSRLSLWSRHCLDSVRAETNSRLPLLSAEATSKLMLDDKPAVAQQVTVRRLRLRDRPELWDSTILGVYDYRKQLHLARTSSSRVRLGGSVASRKNGST